MVAALAAAAVSGCAAYHTPGDAGPDARDEAGLSCTIAGLRRCDLACGGDAGHGSACLEAPRVLSRCLQGLCIPTGAATNEIYPCVPSLASIGYCDDDEVCIADAEFGGGFCVEESVCDEATRVGFPLTCTWSDGTSRLHPLTTSGCPAPARPSTPFCGTDCESCPTYNAQPVLRGVCVGRNDARPFGLCIPPDVCARGTRGPEDVCFGVNDVCQFRELRADTTCGCVVIRGGSAPDGLPDHGWPTSIEACRAYRDMYLDQVECIVDRDWHPAP